MLAFNSWYEEAYDVADGAIGLWEGAVHGDEAGSPLVLPAGATVTLQAGSSLHQGGGMTITSLRHPITGKVHKLCYRHRKTSPLQLSGPMDASGVLAALSLHVALECGRNHLLTRTLSDVGASCAWWW